MACKTIITIDRQYGSGGATIGKQLAKLLDIPFYDREILDIAADKCGMDADALSSVDEKASSSLLYSLVMGTSSTFHSNIGVNYDVPINDKLFIVQSEVIRELAGKGACVLLGHCADYVLREEKNCARIFLYGDFESRVKHVMGELDVSAAEAKDNIVKIDKRRGNYYNYYTGTKWGRTENCDIAIDTSKLSCESVAEIIAEYVKIFEKNHAE